MALVCAISNEVPENPVISPISGSVYERRLIEKMLTENGGKDPINGEPLDKEQLIEIKTPPFVKAKPPNYTSIPGILKMLQDEWDAVMLHSFTLRKQLQTARQELSHALYQHDAACRVIARLTKEVTAAREALATLKPQQPIAAAAQPMGAGEGAGGIAEPVGINPEIQQKLQDTANVLTQERKKKVKMVPEGLASQEAIKEYRCVASHTGLHSASTPGILSMDLVGDIIVTGGNDKTVTVFSRQTEQIVASLKGHSKKVVSVVCHPDQNSVISGSLDSTIRLWDAKSSQLQQVVRAHEGAVTGLSLYATGDYILSSSLDQHWAFSDFRTGVVLAKVLGDDQSPLFSARFHPDGLIFAVGTLNNSLVKIWDLKEQANVANFSGHSGRITSISFSENGYYLATAAEDGCIKLWDLRKLKNFKNIQMPDGHVITDVCFDDSGSYMGVAGTDVRVYGCKNWNEVAIFDDHTARASGIRFGRNANFLASVSEDRSLKIYSSEE